MSKRFRIAFSFAGEKRDFVKEVADLLAVRFGETAILYDKYHEAEFARNDLAIYLPNLYNRDSDLVVVIVCPDYDLKEWTGLEWLAIHNLLQQRRREEVMLCRFARTEVDGLFGGAGFVELDDKTPAQFVKLILERLALNEGLKKEHYTDPVISDPLYWERLHSQPDAFDHRSSCRRWSELDEVAVREFLQRDRVPRQDDYAPDISDEEQFRRFKFIRDDGSICNGTYWCFGKSPSVHFAGATISCYRWQGNDRILGFDDSNESRRGLIHQFRTGVEFIKRNIRLARQISEDGRDEVLEFPESVLEELVANALVHREYQGRMESVQIWVFDDRIEITSPGLLLPPLTVGGLAATTMSHPRNPQVARIFYLSGFVERAGSGMERVGQSLASRGIEGPVFSETDDACFKVVLRRPERINSVVAPPDPVVSEESRVSSFVVPRSSIPHNLPRLQPFFGRKDELRKIADALDPESRTWGALIDGPGGMGKTSLAVRAAYECTPEQFERIVFVSIKDRELDDDGVRTLGNLLIPGLLELLNELARELGHPDIPKSAEDQRIRLLLEALRGTRTLLILDNLEDLLKTERDQIFTFVKKLPAGCKAILTSRRRIGSSADTLILEKLDQAAALETLADLATRIPLLQKTSEAERIALYTQTGGKPLLLRWVVGQLGRGSFRTFTDALAFLRSCPKDNDPLEFIFGDLADEFTPDETKLLCALTYFSLPAKVEHIRVVADSSDALTLEAADTALRSLANRSLVTADDEESAYVLSPLIADFLRKHRPEIVRETGNRLEQRAYALIVENGRQNHDRFPVLDAAWPTVAPAIPVFLAGENERLQTVCDALTHFLDFTGRWDEWLSLSQQAEAKALAAGDHKRAGSRAYQSGWVHNLRQQADAVLACADRAEEHWRKGNASIRQGAFAIRLRGIGHQLSFAYDAAIDNFRMADRKSVV